MKNENQVANLFDLDMWCCVEVPHVNYTDAWHKMEKYFYDHNFVSKILNLMNFISLEISQQV